MKKFLRSFSVFTAYAFSFKRLQRMMAFILPAIMLFATVSIQSAMAAKDTTQVNDVRSIDDLSVDSAPLAGSNTHITNVVVVTAAGSYGSGQHIQIKVVFNNDISVWNEPSLELNTVPRQFATYTGETSAGNALLFDYEVVDGDDASKLNYVDTDSLTLRGGWVTEADDISSNVSLALPAPRSGGLVDITGHGPIVIDTTAPFVQDVSANIANDTYYSNSLIPITLTFSEPVSVAGTPKITTETNRIANYTSSINNGKTLVFNYTTQHGDYSLDLDLKAGSPLSGGSITDAAGNQAIRTLPTSPDPDSLSANKDIFVNATEPIVSNVTSPNDDKSYKYQDTIAITIEFNSAVTVTGNPQLTLSSTNQTATCDDASNITILTCTYTVGVNDNSPDLDALSLNGGTVTDTADTAMPALRTLPLPPNSLGANKQIVIDTTAPTVSFTRQTPLALDPYIQPQSPLTFLVTFSEPVTGVDVGDFIIHSNDTTATIDSPIDETAPGTQFTVTIRGSDLATFNGDVGLDLSSSLDIHDQAGNPLALVEPTPATDNDQIYTLDSKAPDAPTISTVGTEGYINDSTPTITGTVSATDKDVKTVTIFLDGSSTPNGTADPDKSGTWIYTFQSALGEGNHQIIATATDKAGNSSPASDPPTSFTVDITPPTLGIPTYPTPAPPEFSPNSKFVFTSSDQAPVTFMCKLTNALGDAIPNNIYSDYISCSTFAHQVISESDGPQQLDFIPELKDGSYELWVYVVDKAKNQYPPLDKNNKPTAIQVVWNLKQPPKLITPSRPSFDPLQIFEFSSQNDNATFTCSLDGNPFPLTACTSPIVYFGLADLHYYGFHDFSVQTVLADNTQGGIKPFHWLFDDTKIDTTPPLTTSSKNATFTFSAQYTDADNQFDFECSLDGSDFVSCSDPKKSQTYPVLGLGNHTFRVRAVTSGLDTDDAHITVTDPTPAQYSWTILAAPTPTPTPTPKERISNGGFDLYKGTSKTPIGWAPLGLSASDGKNTTYKKNGIASVSMIGSAGKIKTLMQTIVNSGKVGDTLTFSFWARGVSIPTAGLCQAQVVFYNGTAKVQTAKPIPCKTGTYATFQKQVATIKATSAYTKIVVQLIYTKASGVIWFDMVSLIK